MRIFITLASFLLAQSIYAKPRNEPISPIYPAKGLNPAKVELGKKLFFEKRLSKSARISCNSCHNLAIGGTDNMRVSLGHGFVEGPINSPTVYNSSYNIAQFWDGRAKDLKEQAGGPIANPKEMASSHKIAVRVLNSIPAYVKEFESVYGKKSIDIDQVTDAITEFEKSLVTPNSRFDKWLKGDDKALSKKELLGYEKFKSTGCIACHTGAAVGGTMYQKFGVVKAPAKRDANLGRFSVTKVEAEKYFFKVPTLRNIELTYPYFHDGSVWDLKEAIKIMAELQLGAKLSKKDISDIAAFLKTLTGEKPVISYPELPASTLKTPRPKL